MRKVYLFSYPVAFKSLRASEYTPGSPDVIRFSYRDLHRMRSLEMYAILKSIMFSTSRYEHGGTLLNLPHNWSTMKHRAHRENIENRPNFSSESVLILPCRFPLDDQPFSNTRSIYKSNTDVEVDVRKGVEYFFSSLDRHQAVLSENVSSEADTQLTEYKEIDFSVDGDARVRKLNGEKLKVPTAVGFLFSCTLRNGTRLLSAFSMGGYETMCWSEFLAKHPDLVLDTLQHGAPGSNNFVLGEFIPPRNVSWPFFDCEFRRVKKRPISIGEIRLVKKFA